MVWELWFFIGLIEPRDPGPGPTRIGDDSRIREDVTDPLAAGLVAGQVEQPVRGRHRGESPLCL